jgi:hypothetical protein
LLVAPPEKFKMAAKLEWPIWKNWDNCHAYDCDLLLLGSVPDINNYHIHFQGHRTVAWLYTRATDIWLQSYIWKIQDGGQ